MIMYMTITGKSGSGKSKIGKYLEENYLNFLYLDIDQIGHLVLDEKKVKEEVSRTFHLPLTDNGKMIRNLLSSMVFQSPEKMKEYASITWPRMEERIDTIQKENQDKIIILDWALIPKTKYFKGSIFNILVEAPYEVRLSRAMARDFISEEKFMEREQASCDYDNLDFDFVLKNIDLEITKGMVNKIYEKSIISRKF